MQKEKSAKGIRIAAGIVAVGLLCMLCTPTAKADTVTNGDIASVQQGDLYTMNPDGTNVTAVTSGIRAPAYSPDGTQFAYDDTADIWTMNADGTNKAQVTNDSNVNHHYSEPDWSPDGTQLAYSMFDFGTFSSGIYTANVNGTNQVFLANGRKPVWAPDGLRIAYQGSNNNVWVINVNGSNNIDLGLDGLTQDWSPDGTKILATTYDGSSLLFTVNPDGTGEQTLTNYVVYTATYSPDGTKIAYNAVANNNNINIFVTNSDGTNTVQITNDAASFGYVTWQPIITPDPPAPTPDSGGSSAVQTDSASALSEAGELPKAGVGVAGYSVALAGYAALRQGKKRWDIQRKRRNQ